jgi:hypothetical protein
MKEQRLEILRKVVNGELSPEQAHTELLGLSIVRPSLWDWVEKNQQEAWDKMGDTGNYDYATDKNNWNEENYWFGYFRALENFEWQFLDSNED